MALSKKQSLQRNQILESLYLHGSQSRADLARRLGITPATMTEITGVMIKQGVLTETGDGARDSGIGRKRVLLDVRPQLAYYMGIELGENKVTICLTDNLGQLVENATVHQTVDSTFLLTEKNLIELIHSYIDTHCNYSIKAVALAVPGHYEQESQTIVSNQTFWSNFDLASVISEISIPVYVKNNVKCMALAQLYLSSTKNKLNFLFLNLKRGIFASYVYDGHIYGDKNYLVGEVGHLVVNPNGEQCECGKAGCLQTYASIPWMLKKARHALASGRTSYLKLLADCPEEVELNDLFYAYQMGDEFVHRIVEQALDYLVLQINNSQMILDVDAIYIHGKLFEEPLIMRKLQAKLAISTQVVQQERAITRQVLPYCSNRGAIGACALAIKKHFIEGEIENS
ncbi:ROK family transcriptional regulator [Streptococcus sp. S784/96/1]|uniref:ROK family transcriptional regulator n=1 Tax=Streptococcus sp. S784/96/1 TaxID=2653499 RepID=UPI001386BF19|nr:ROK family transcriptional regulator [Streptococcus sp. S784/96/1]